MPYPTADPNDLDRLSPGDQITADVVVTPDHIQLKNIVVVKKSDGKSAPTGAQLPPSEREGPVPDFALVNQDGKRIDLRQYRGSSVLLTFIYTRCPLPDYCPLMSHNFAQIEKALVQTPDDLWQNALAQHQFRFAERHAQGAAALCGGIRYGSGATHVRALGICHHTGERKQRCNQVLRPLCQRRTRSNHPFHEHGDHLAGWASV